jgi:hypothetical protein
MLAHDPTGAALSTRATTLPRSRISTTATTTATVGRVVYASNESMLTARRGWCRQLPHQQLRGTLLNEREACRDRDEPGTALREASDVRGGRGR